jgi:predicted nucleic acid-binding protein
VAADFFDTSAVVKRYDTRESGSARVLALCDPVAGNTLVLADITSPEVASALGRKRRMGEIDEQELQRLWTQFVGHRQTDYRFVQLDTSIYRHAELILLAHALRAIDAIQIACALHVRPILAPLDPDFRFVTADERQAAAAQAEGLAVELVA